MSPKKVLVVLDDHEVKARVAVAQARLDQANAVLSRASSDFRRTSGLLEKRATTKERFEASQSDFQSATAAVDAAAAALKEAEIHVDYTTIRAPLGGVIAERLAEPGAVRFKPILLTAGTSMMGTWVMVLDPIFSGLAWAFIFGILASTAFTLIVVPLIWFKLYGRKPAEA